MDIRGDGAGTIVRRSLSSRIRSSNIRLQGTWNCCTIYLPIGSKWWKEAPSPVAGTVWWSSRCFAPEQGGKAFHVLAMNLEFKTCEFHRVHYRQARNHRQYPDPAGSGRAPHRGREIGRASCRER